MNYFTGYNTDVLWFPIAENLKEFLTNYINQDGTPLFSDMINYEDMNIGIGSKGTARATYPCLEILFDSEEKGVIHTKIKEGTTNLWLDCYVSDNTTLELTLTKDTYSTGITTNKRKFPSSIRMYRG